MPVNWPSGFRRKRQQYPYVLREHVFDKVRSLDIGLAEFEQLLGAGEVIEETPMEPLELKELVLVLDWVEPLHVVCVVDEVRREERIVTVYRPDRELWSSDFRRRR